MRKKGVRTREKLSPYALFAYTVITTFYQILCSNKHKNIKEIHTFYFV